MIFYSLCKAGNYSTGLFVFPVEMIVLFSTSGMLNVKTVNVVFTPNPFALIIEAIILF